MGNYYIFILKCTSKTPLIIAHKPHYLIEGLILAIIVVFELPPKESWYSMHGKHSLCHYIQPWISEQNDIHTCSKKVSFESRYGTWRCFPWATSTSIMITNLKQHKKTSSLENESLIKENCRHNEESTHYVVISICNHINTHTLVFNWKNMLINSYKWKGISFQRKR